MDLPSAINLQVEDAGPHVKLCWWYGPDRSLNCTYKVSQAELLQAGESVREQLFALVELRLGARSRQEIDSQRYARVLHSLLRRGQDFRDSLFRRVGGCDGDEVDRLKEYISAIARAGATDEPSSSADDDARKQPLIKIILCEATINLPWSFVCVDDQPRPTGPLTKSVLDFGDYWLRYFRLSVQYQNSNPMRPNRNNAKILLALHGDLHQRAYDEIARQMPETREVFDSLLAQAHCCTDSWNEIEDKWRDLHRSPGEDPNSVVYVMGHSDGEQILLKDDTSDADYVLPASSFCRTFRKSRDTPSASIVLLNACQSGAPSGTHWPPGFIKATWMKGFFGFVGTEIKVPNVLATMYGFYLLQRLQTRRETLGEAFDAMLTDQSLFPLSLAYTCFADRNFRLAEGCASAAPSMGG